MWGLLLIKVRRKIDTGHSMARRPGVSGIASSCSDIALISFNLAILLIFVLLFFYVLLLKLIYHISCYVKCCTCCDISMQLLLKLNSVTLLMFVFIHSFFLLIFFIFKRKLMIMH
jgi:hypothetical protein